MYNKYMPKTSKTNPYTLYVLSGPALLLLTAAVIGGFIGVNKSTGSDSSVLGSKNSTTKGKVSSQVHRENLEEVTTNIEEIAEVEKSVGNTRASENLNKVAETVIEEADDTAEVIEEVEDRPGWKTALVGPDYKNLGQLRSTVAQNTNNIRKLSGEIENVVAGNSDTTLQDQLTALNAERERIRALIMQQENKFSVFGWVSRIMSGYDNRGNGGIVPLTEESSESTN